MLVTPKLLEEYINQALERAEPGISRRVGKTWVYYFEK